MLIGVLKISYITYTKNNQTFSNNLFLMCTLVTFFIMIPRYFIKVKNSASYHCNSRKVGSLIPPAFSFKVEFILAQAFCLSIVPINTIISLCNSILPMLHPRLPPTILILALSFLPPSAHSLFHTSLWYSLRYHHYQIAAKHARSQQYLIFLPTPANLHSGCLNSSLQFQSALLSTIRRKTCITLWTIPLELNIFHLHQPFSLIIHLIQIHTRNQQIKARITSSYRFDFFSMSSLDTP